MKSRSVFLVLILVPLLGWGMRERDFSEPEDCMEVEFGSENVIRCKREVKNASGAKDAKVLDFFADFFAKLKLGK